jgi:hypothetical protein
VLAKHKRLVAARRSPSPSLRPSTALRSRTRSPAPRECCRPKVSRPAQVSSPNSGD